MCDEGKKVDTETSETDASEMTAEPDTTTATDTAEAIAKNPHARRLISVYEAVEMIAAVTIFVMLCFAFVTRLNIVDGHSMDVTLADREYLMVSDLFYTPRRGDIVVIHDIDASPYDTPIVKRVIAVGGQKVEIDFSSWTLRVDGEIVEEPYRYLDVGYAMLTAEYNMDVTGTYFTCEVPEGKIFVMGDNRNHSGDSRQIEIGPVDERCVVGRAYFRLYPLNRLGALH